MLARCLIINTKMEVIVKNKSVNRKIIKKRSKDGRNYMKDMNTLEKLKKK
jgi:hypothetical protein